MEEKTIKNGIISKKDFAKHSLDTEELSKDLKQARAKSNYEKLKNISFRQARMIEDLLSML